MHYNELMSLLKWAEGIGIHTMQGLACFKFLLGLKSNNQLLNKTHEMFVNKIMYEELL